MPPVRKSPMESVTRDGHSPIQPGLLGKKTKNVEINRVWRAGIWGNIYAACIVRLVFKACANGRLIGTMILSEKIPICGLYSSQKTGLSSHLHPAQPVSVSMPPGRKKNSVLTNYKTEINIANIARCWPCNADRNGHEGRQKRMQARTPDYDHRHVRPRNGAKIYLVRQHNATP